MQIIVNVDYQGEFELSQGITYLYSVRRKSEFFLLQLLLNSGDRLDIVGMYYGEINGSNMRLVPCEKSEFAPVDFDNELMCSRSSIFRYYANKQII